MQKEYLATLMEDLKKLVTSETVVGEPIKVNDVTILPIVGVTFGFGSGGNDGTAADSKKNQGLGAGGGAKITPLAFLVVNENEVSLLQIQHNKANTSLDRFIDLMPGLMDKFSNQFLKKKTNLSEAASEVSVKLNNPEIKTEI